MRTECDKEEDLTEHIRSLGLQDIREGVTLQRVALQRLGLLESPRIIAGHLNYKVI